MSCIKINETRVLGKHRLVCTLSFSNDVKKYFKSSLLFVEYDSDIQNVDSSILNIPLVANLVPAAWAIGADISVPNLDSIFCQSLDKIKLIMKKWYPQLSFSTNISVEKMTNNVYPAQSEGMLFSGGLDSSATYVSNRPNIKHLMMVWGADIPLAEKECWANVKSRYLQFAKVNHVKLHVIKTNLRESLNESKLSNEFGKYLPDQSWWGGIQHSILLLSLCAPITVTENIGALLIASSVNPTYLKSGLLWGSLPTIDNNVSWGNTQVFHDASNLSRQEKIKNVLKEDIQVNGHYPLLRVCWEQFRDFNCCQCDKCMRTITGLVLENIDPNKCGFRIDENFFTSLKNYFVEGGLDFFSGDIGYWKDIQRNIPQQISHNVYNSREFFEWFRNFDISEKKSYKKTLIGKVLVVNSRVPRKNQKVVLNAVGFMKKISKKRYGFQPLPEEANAPS